LIIAEDSLAKGSCMSPAIINYRGEGNGAIKSMQITKCYKIGTYYELSIAEKTKIASQWKYRHLINIVQCYFDSSSCHSAKSSFLVSRHCRVKQIVEFAGCVLALTRFTIVASWKKILILNRIQRLSECTTRDVCIGTDRFIMLPFAFVPRH
jgi:hypothetical protein